MGKQCGCGEMADAADSKSADGDIVRVRLPPSALFYSKRPAHLIMSRSFNVHVLCLLHGLFIAVFPFCPAYYCSVRINI